LDLDGDPKPLILETLNPMGITQLNELVEQIHRFHERMLHLETFWKAERKAKNLFSVVIPPPARHSSKNSIA